MLEDKRLISKVNRGDKNTLRQLYEKYKDDILTIATSLLNETGEAEDILHDVFISFVKAAGQFQIYGNIRNYLITCVVNCVRDKYRRKMYQVTEVQRTRPTSLKPDNPEIEAEETEKSELLTKALGQLPYQQREVIVLHLLGEMTFGEIARLQGISINTAEGRYRYGLDKLNSDLIGDITE